MPRHWLMQLLGAWMMWHIGIEQGEVVWSLVQTYEEGDGLGVTPEEGCHVVKEMLKHGPHAEFAEALVCLPADLRPPGGSIREQLPSAPPTSGTEILPRGAGHI
jgi:hypothetical protein